MAGKLISAGSINQDILLEVERQPLKGETVTGKSVSYAPGGKGANQAVAAARAGAKTQLVAAVGDDEFGNELLLHIKNQGVLAEQILTKSKTTTGLAIVMIEGGDNSILIFPGANALLTPEDVENVELSKNDIVLTQCEIPQATSLAFLNSAKSAGACSIINPTPVADLDPALLHQADYLIVNEIEMATIGAFEDGANPKIENVLELQNSYGLTGVICTLGANGVIATNQNETYQLPGIPTDVVDTTGAGDSFVGVFGASLLAGMDFYEALIYANLAGSLTVQGLGAQTSMPSKSQLEEAYRKLAPPSSL